MITRLFSILSWALAAWVVCSCCSASAFTLPASSLVPSACWGRTTVLYAGKKAKKKKTKTASGGGGGFGSTRTVQKKQSTPVDSETTALTVLYTKQWKEEEEREDSPPVPGGLVQISQTPLMFTIDNFIDPAACARVQSNSAGCFDLDFPRLLSDCVFNGQESELDGLLFTHSSSRDAPHAVDTSAAAAVSTPISAYPDGLHMDTNGQCLFRHVTAILYLNDVPENCGGATVFPLARALPRDPAVVASHRLLVERISHTRSPTCAKVGLGDDARLLESRVGTNFGQRPDTDTAIRVQPKAGRLLVFFSRHGQSGAEDPRAWHAGERLLDGRNGLATEKRILTMFKEVDYATDLEPSLAETTFEEFLSPQIRQQQTWLQGQV